MVTVSYNKRINVWIELIKSMVSIREQRNPGQLWQLRDITEDLRQLLAVYYPGTDGYVNPNNGKTISSKTFSGNVRTTIEEHSSSSRQHYFKYGQLSEYGCAPNLFYNEQLMQRNNDCAWSPSTAVRGNGWRMIKDSRDYSRIEQLRPDVSTLRIALLERKVGARGRQPLSKQSANVSFILSVSA